MEMVTPLLDEGKDGSKYSYKRALIGPPTKRRRADDVPTLNAALVALWFSGDPDQYF